MSNYDTSKLDAYVDAIPVNHPIPGVDLIVTKDGRTVYRRMAGYSDLPKTRPVSSDDRYFVYSMSKVISTACVMKLVEQGILDLDRDISDYIPEFAHMEIHEHGQKRPAANRISLRLLLSMQAGFDYDLGAPEIKSLEERSDHTFTAADFARVMATRPLLFEPGTASSYALSIDIAGGIAEVVTSRRFEDLCDEYIFTPLGMRDTTFHPTDAQLAHIAQQYTYDHGTGHAVPIEPKNVYVPSICFDSAGGGIYCSTEDYSRFIAAMSLCGISADGVRILSEASVREMATSQLCPAAEAGFRSDRIGYSYGLGVRTLVAPEEGHQRSHIGEFGWDGALGAYNLADPTAKISITYIQNVGGYPLAIPLVHGSIRDIVFETFDR